MAVVTHDWKYVYWYYGSGMAPTEELFRLPDDPLEMSNVAAEPRHAATLESLRNAYDAEVAALRQNGNPDHGYSRYKILFDRAIPWNEKASLLPRSQPGSGRTN